MAISLYELSQRISSSMPLGTIVPYYGTDEPSGWKICDGRSCAGSELAKKLGISNVPDLRGRFIRMIGGNAAGMAVAQGDCIRNITGTIPTDSVGRYKISGAFVYSGQGGGASGNSSNNDFTKFDASRVVPTGPENRPINTAFNYIIKVNTNVILYYVSNIIYKAIAIEKSLLSRAKEEVRRTMAISLNNHEDRIVKLENMYSATGMQLLFNGQYIPNGNHITLTKPFSDFDLILVNTSNDQWGHTSFFTVDLEHGILLNQFMSYGDDLRYMYHDTNEYGLSFKVGDLHSTTVRIIKQGLGDIIPIRQIYGVRFTKAILYSFSYIIIYRLTQILFDSSLLGLFSQKGGARTI